MIDAIDRYLADTHEAAVARLCELLRIPSVSTDPAHAGDLMTSAAWTADHLRRIGLQAEVLNGAARPAVYAESAKHDATRPTVLIYGHHDVQPPGDESRWASPPFEPRVTPEGRIYARGAADNKGQFFLQLRAVEAWNRVAGATPVNVKVLIEGEEEVGSPSLPALLEAHRRRLACDLVVVSDTPLWQPGRPALSLGTRGITGLEVRVTGPDRDLHSGIYGGSVPNPIAALARMLAGLHDAAGRVNVPGFYDDVRPIPPDLRAHWEQLCHELQATPEPIGCSPAGEQGYNVLERRWLRPTVEFNGITGGYQGPGSNTIVPSWASAKITCRLVPDQHPQRIQTALRDHLQRLAPAGLRVDFLLRESNAAPYSIDRSHPAVAAAERVLTRVYGVPPAWVREGLSLPILPLFKAMLGADTVLLGFCHPACNAHSFDEFFDAGELHRGARVAARFLAELPAHLAREAPQ